MKKKVKLEVILDLMKTVDMGMFPPHLTYINNDKYKQTFEIEVPDKMLTMLKTLKETKKGNYSIRVCCYGDIKK